MMRKLTLLLAALTSVQLAIFADAAKSEDAIGGGRSKLVDTVFRECGTLLRERRKAGGYSNPCYIEKAIPFDLEATCGIAVDNFRLAKEELDRIVTRCVPDYIFGKGRYSAHDYAVKSVILDKIIKIDDVNDRVHFGYNLKECGQKPTFHGFIFHKSIPYLYLSATIPAYCVAGGL